MKTKQSLLNKLVILYVEDDTVIREELKDLLLKFFKKIYLAKDGVEGIEKYKKHKDEINIILSDINMPNMNGIDMVKKIRELDENVPVIYTTAYSDVEYLSESITLRITDYIIKPIDVKRMLNSLSTLSQTLYNKDHISKQNSELKRYKDVIDTYNIVIKTDIEMNIIYVNELFCETTGFNADELLGENFSKIMDYETEEDNYKEICQKIGENSSWNGVLKQVKNDDEIYSVESDVVTTLDENDEISGTIFIQRDITDQLNKKREVQVAMMRDKGELFIKNKEVSAESEKEISRLKEQIGTGTHKYVEIIKELKIELQRARKDLQIYEDAIDEEGEHSSTILKLNRENQLLRLQNSELMEKSEDEKGSLSKTIHQREVNYKTQIDDLHEELKNIKDKFASEDDKELLQQKAEYWKIKTEKLANKIENAERFVMQLSDKTLYGKIFKEE